MILSIFIDYYILENNSLLKAALKYKRIQLADFRIVPTEHFGEKKALVSICRLNAVTACCDSFVTGHIFLLTKICL